MRRAAALGLTAAIACLSAAADARAEFTPGSAGLGDPFFPFAGNGGYDAAEYEISLDYTPDSNRLEGRTRVRAIATQDLSAFDLDYRGPRVESVRVAGAAAAFERQGQELVVTPAAGIPSGRSFTAVVKYRGQPDYIEDPDGSKEGWIQTDDGAFVVGEPQGAPTWFPCNDYPTDKARFSFNVTVPNEVKAVSNGRLAARDRHGKRTTWRWRVNDPMATYLATATVGRFKLQRSSFSGIKSIVALDPRVAEKSERVMSKIPRMTKFFRSLYGPYPFGQTGAIVDHAPQVGYALETQTRPIFDSPTDEATLAHEIAHQWFGDSVSLASWPQMWLNEGFATWSEWRWTQEAGGISTAKQFRELMREPADRDLIWDPAPAAIPGPSKLFAQSVYVRGGMALEALRQQIGNDAFYATLRTWAADHAYGNVSIDQFIALAEAESGQQLDELFQTWLYTSGKPA